MKPIVFPKIQPSMTFTQQAICCRAVRYLEWWYMKLVWWMSSNLQHLNREHVIVALEKFSFIPFLQPSHWCFVGPLPFEIIKKNIQQNEMLVILWGKSAFILHACNSDNKHTKAPTKLRCILNCLDFWKLIKTRTNYHKKLFTETAVASMNTRCCCRSYHTLAVRVKPLVHRH